MYSHAAANGTDKSGNPQNAGSPPSSVRPFLIQIQCAVVSYRTAVCPYDRVLPSLLPDCLRIHRRRPDQPLETALPLAVSVFLSALPMTALYWTLAVILKTPVFSMVLGLATMVPSVLFINTKYGFCTRPAILFT